MNRMIGMNGRRIRQQLGPELGEAEGLHQGGRIKPRGPDLNLHSRTSKSIWVTTAEEQATPLPWDATTTGNPLASHLCFGSVKTKNFQPSGHDQQISAKSIAWSKPAQNNSPTQQVARKSLDKAYSRPLDNIRYH